MLRVVVDAAGGRLPVWCGVAGLGTTEVVEAAAEAEGAGADALLVLPPLFFDMSDAELERHFAAVSAAVGVPVLAYDVPPRTPRKLPPSLIGRLGAAGSIQGVKDSSGSVTAARLLCLLTSEISGFACYIGTEAAIDAAVALGFAGSVPGLANILPAVAARVDAAARAGDWSAAEQDQRIYVALLELLSLPLADASPVTVAFDAFKAATAHVLGIEQPRTALRPMTAPDAAFIDAVTAIVDPLAKQVAGAGNGR
jgi:4-hydroxy-tetrahydrodipicolinate synthase